MFQKRADVEDKSSYSFKASSRKHFCHQRLKWFFRIQLAYRISFRLLTLGFRSWTQLERSTKSRKVLGKKYDQRKFCFSRASLSFKVCDEITFLLSRGKNRNVSTGLGDLEKEKQNLKENFARRKSHIFYFNFIC